MALPPVSKEERRIDFHEISPYSDGEFNLPVTFTGGFSSGKAAKKLVVFSGRKLPQGTCFNFPATFMEGKENEKGYNGSIENA